MKISAMDHIVFTVRDLEETISFYRDILGMEAVQFGEGRWALKFGSNKINLHEKGHEFEPKAENPTPGAMDICLLTDESIERWIEFLMSRNIRILEGPVQRTGAMGVITSVYINDPDSNLIEISRYSK